MDLPPGFRFHPTDEELITHYLSPKILDSTFCAKAIGEVDLNKVEPWELPWRAKIGEKEWYFFCVRDRKYPTGMRTNRATEAGYWKATGKDKEIFQVKTLVGMKKTLVFYKGRAPKGEKSNWVMHEYRLMLEGNHSMQNLPKTSKNEWVICRIFKKTAGGKKIHISGLTRSSVVNNDHLGYSNLPPLLDLSSYEYEAQNQASLAETSSHVPCFSKLVVKDRPSLSDFTNTYQIMPFYETVNQDQSIMKLLFENNLASTNENVKTEYSQDTGMSTDISSSTRLSNYEVGLRQYDDDQDFPMMTSTEPAGIDCFWSY